MFGQSTGLLLPTVGVASGDGMLHQAIYAALDRLATEGAAKLAIETVLEFSSNQLPHDVAALAVPAVHVIPHIIVILL